MRTDSKCLALVNVLATIDHCIFYEVEILSTVTDRSRGQLNALVGGAGYGGTGFIWKNVASVVESRVFSKFRLFRLTQTRRSLVAAILAVCLSVANHGQGQARGIVGTREEIIVQLALRSYN